MTVAPASASVLLGATQTFTATVSNTTNLAVTWTVNGVGGGNSSVGTVSATGTYTAPRDLPAQTSITVAAISVTDSSKSGSAQVSVTSDITVSFSSSPASVELGATGNFTAAVTSAGNPDRTILFALSGAGCNGAACGTVDSGGHFTAPQILPLPATVTLTAQSAADASKQKGVAIQITSSFILTLNGPTSIPPGSAGPFTATFFLAPNSNPSLAINWQVSGAGCTGSGCGTLNVTSAQSNPGMSMYTAPATPPAPNVVTIWAISQADPSKVASMIVTIPGAPAASVRISPASATLAVSHRQTLSVQVTGAASSTVNWTVNGVSGGNAVVGQICATATAPCQAVTSSNASSVDYVAPAATPLPNPVTVTATSQANPSVAASVPITILAHVVVSVAPPSATISPAAVHPFTATVLGTADQNVIWQVQGAGCLGSGSPCGVIDANGFYTAPIAAPSPDALRVVAVSSEDPAQSGFSQVAISVGPEIVTILPASIFAGAAGGFTLRVEGAGFAGSSPGPGSVILAGGAARTTVCLTTSNCTTTLSAADLAAAGNLTVQIKNPDGTASNQVVLVVVPPSTGEGVVALSSGSPKATGKDIVAVEPSTAGTSAAGTNVDLNVAALGLFQVINNSCALGGNPVVLVRPASGIGTADICVFSNSGLDPGMTYTVSGPGDVSVAGQQPAGLGIIHLTLQILSTAAAGPRTLFIVNSNLDKAAATGALLVK